MAKPQILQMRPYPERDQIALDGAFEMLPFFNITSSEQTALLQRHGAGLRGIATRGAAPVPNEVIAACPNLEIIAVYGVGYDGIDIATCKARGIRVTNTPDVLTGDVADLAMGMMLAQMRGIAGADAWVREGEWARSGPYPLKRRAFGARAGILGLGRIGRAIAERLGGFQVAISYCDIAAQPDAPHWRFVDDPVRLAEEVDILFVTLTASAQTRHIVNAAVLEALGAEGLLVNVSRAANVDEQALLSALETGRLGAAALDVFEGEPDLDPRFLALPNVLLQPHHASATHETRAAMGQLMRDNLTAHFAGEPLLTPVV